MRNLKGDSKMKVEKLLIKAKSNPELRAAASKGLKERLESRERIFQNNSMKRAANEGFYARSYNL